MKFRVWDVKQKVFLAPEWPYFIDRDGDLCFVIKGSAAKCDKSETVSVFSTGKTDKNGAELFCGDVITNGDINIKYVIEWTEDASFMARQISNKSSVGLSYWRDRIEKIGNIFENPEFIEVK